MSMRFTLCGPGWRECRRWHRVRQAEGPGYIVCGDAAGYLDPATGDGLRFAIASGLRAGAIAVAVSLIPIKEARQEKEPGGLETPRDKPAADWRTSVVRHHASEYGDHCEAAW